MTALLLAGCTPPTPTAATWTPAPSATLVQASATLPPTETPTPLPSPSASPTPGCADTAGSLVTGSLLSQSLPDPLRFIVYLPACYAQETAERYPVLYLFHGLFFDESQWVGLGAVQAADRLIAAGQVPPFIMVLPYDPSGKEPDQYGFAEAVTADLLPYIDAAYRTLADPVHRAAGGLSRGGGWAIHFGLTRPDLFGSIGMHSPALFWADNPHYDDWLAALPRESLPRIWIDVGTDDHELEAVRSFEKFLNEEDVPHEFHLYVGFHDEAYWSAHVEQYLRWYAAGWQER